MTQRKFYLNSCQIRLQLFTFCLQVTALLPSNIAVLREHREHALLYESSDIAKFLLLKKEFSGKSEGIFLKFFIEFYFLSDLSYRKSLRENTNKISSKINVLSEEIYQLSNALTRFFSASQNCNQRLMEYDNDAVLLLCAGTENHYLPLRRYRQICLLLWQSEVINCHFI